MCFLGNALQTVSAQAPPTVDFDRYEPLRSGGEIPAEFLRRSSDKYRDQKEAIRQDDNRPDRLARDKFLLQSSFMIDELLLSGKVVFGDPVSSYLNEIKDHLLRDQPALRDSIRIYLVKSPSVNAFATNDGIILFNAGLLARLENEAELAFVLCHEFQHFIHAHPMNRYVETQRMSRERIFSVGDLEQYFLARNQYSRELEMEADDLGLDLFLSSGYAREAVDGVLNALRYSYLPFGEEAWPRRFFETPNLRFPASYHLDSVAPVDAREDQDDSRSTHPNIATRRARARERLAGVDGEQGSAFVIDAQRFRLSREVCRFEVAQLYLEQRRYEEAIYQAFLLMQDHPGSFFLDKVVSHAVYALARHKNERNFFEVHTDFEGVEGESQRLYYFMEQMQKAEMNVWALDWCWRMHHRYPGDRELAAICKDLLHDLFRCHRETAESMSHDAPPEGFFDRWDGKKGDSVSGDKREEGGTASEKPPADYFQHAFADYFKDPEFARAYQERMIAGPETNDEEYLPPQRRRRQERKRQLKGEALGLEKVVFVDPDYKKIDERKKVQEEFIASEKAQRRLLGLISETAERAGLEQDILSNHQLSPGDIDRFNDLAVMEQWIADYLRGMDNDTRMVNLYADEAREIAEKYGSDHFAYTGFVVLSRRKKMTTVAGLIVTGMFIIPLPYVIAALATPRRIVLYVNLVFDVEKNELLMEEARSLTVSPHKYIIKSHLYSSMHQMKLK